MVLFVVFAVDFFLVHCFHKCPVTLDCEFIFIGVLSVKNLESLAVEMVFQGVLI